MINDVKQLRRDALAIYSDNFLGHLNDLALGSHPFLGACEAMHCARYPGAEGDSLALRDPAEPITNRSYLRSDGPAVRADAAVLGMMLANPESTSVGERELWEMWLELVVSRRAGTEWLAGRRAGWRSQAVPGILEAVRARTAFEHCRAGGVKGEGCLRDGSAQVCAAKPSFKHLLEMEKRWGAKLDALEVKVPHSRAAVKSCKEMVSARICLDDAIAKLSGHYSSQIRERYSPDDQDECLVKPTSPRSRLIPCVRRLRRARESGPFA